MATRSGRSVKPPKWMIEREEDGKVTHKKAPSAPLLLPEEKTAAASASNSKQQQQVPAKNNKKPAKRNLRADEIADMLNDDGDGLDGMDEDMGGSDEEVSFSTKSTTSSAVEVPAKVPVYKRLSMNASTSAVTVAKKSNDVKRPRKVKKATPTTAAAVDATNVYDLDMYGDEFGSSDDDNKKKKAKRKRRAPAKKKHTAVIVLTHGTGNRAQVGKF